MNPIVMETTLVRADWDALNQYILQRLPDGLWMRYGFAIWSIGAFVACAIVGYLLRPVGSSIEVADVLTAVVICIAVSALLHRFQLRSWCPREVGYVLGPCRYEIDAGGIRTIGAHRTSFLEWRCIDAVDETAQHLFLPLDRIAACILPKRDLTPEAIEAIKDLARTAGVSTRAELAPPAAAAGWPAPSAQVPADASPSIGFFDALRWNFRATLWLLVFEARRATFVANVDQAAVFSALNCVLLLLLTWIGAEAGAEFQSFGLYSWLYFAGAGLLAAVLIARAQGARADVLPFLVPALAVAPFVVTVVWLIDALIEPRFGWPAARIFAWGVVVVYTMMAVQVAYQPVKVLTRVATVVAIVGLISLAQATSLFFFSPWQVPYDPGEYNENLYASETLLFEQPGRIAAAAGRIEGGVENEPDVFFVGFAGYGMQGVFRREALFAQKTFADRYGSGARSLALINDDEDQETYPLAMVPGLREALKQIGTRMNREEDVLVLMLTSHGSEDGELSVVHPTAELRSLTGADVRTALDDAGIKWRVVIVSACYAGTFIEPLATPETLVITAADADHNSFGCADERDLTYFGEAFLRDSLPDAQSLQAAFERTRELIAKREAAEGKTHSNPQMVLGAAIAGRLEQLEAARLTRP